MKRKYTSLADAAELQAKMQAFGDFLRDKECCR